MPQIDSEKLEKLSANLKEKWAGKPCQMCQKGNWIIQNSCFEIREFHNGIFMPAGQLIPVIPITCSYCSNTVFINAILAGVVEVEKKKNNE